MSTFIYITSVFLILNSGLQNSREPSTAVEAGRQELKVPAVEDIENHLFTRISQERRRRGIPALERWPELNDLARRHSRDMAEQGRLSHISSRSETYTDRLVAADMLFKVNGENIAFSETFVARFIHDSLMKSREHRENLINPDFDKVGIGVVWKKGRGYYITQDFLGSFTSGEGAQLENPRSRTSGNSRSLLEAHLNDLKERTATAINIRRHERSLPPIEFLEPASALAEEFSERRVQGLPRPPLPLEFRRHHILYLFVTAPSLEAALPELALFQNSQCRRGGIGIRFGRNQDHPGGTYFFTGLVFLEKDFTGMNEEEQTEIVRNELVHIRRAKGLQALSEIEALSEAARNISRDLMQKAAEEPQPPRRGIASHRIFTYVTRNPSRVPEDLQKHFIRNGLKGFGLGVIYDAAPESLSGRFWITIILMHGAR